MFVVKNDSLYKYNSFDLVTAEQVAEHIVLKLILKIEVQIAVTFLKAIVVVPVVCYSLVKLRPFDLQFEWKSLFDLYIFFLRLPLI